MHAMFKSKPNRVLLSLILLLFSSSVSTSKSVAPKLSFNRPDPLKRLKSYNAAYDINNKHYWASAAFMGIHGYAIGGVWMIFGLGFGIFMVVRNLNGGTSPNKNHPDSYYFLLFFLVLLLTFLAIVAASFVLAANWGTLRTTKKLKETIFGAGGDARRTIRKVTNAMKEMQYLLLPYDPATCLRLNLTSYQLEKESRMIRRFIHKKSHFIDVAIESSFVANLVVVTINAVLLVASLVLLLLHWHPGFIIIILCFWILTTLCWVLTGFDFFLHTFAKDSCSAFKDFQRNPHNSSLSSVVPCVASAYSDKILVEIGYTVHNFITKLSSKILLLQRLLELDGENDELSGGLWKICDPFEGAPSYSYVPDKCPKDAIPIGDLPIVLSRFTCYKENSTGTCKGNGKFIPEASYNMAWAYTHSIQGLINIFPDLLSLTQCSFVKNTFSYVVSHQCEPFRVSVRLLWSSMLSLSIIMVVLVLSWVAKLFQEEGRSFSACSVIPKPSY